MNNLEKSDEILLLAMKDGDQAAFNTLFDRYWAVLYKTTYNFTRDREASSGIVHDIFLNLWTRRDDLVINSLKGYMSAAARYHTFRYLKLMGRVHLEFVEENLLEGGVAFNQGEVNIREAELQRKMEGHIGSLPKRCQEIFTLSRVDHLSNDEIAERLDISKRTVENQLTHALHHLRVSLKDISISLLICQLINFSIC